MSEEDQERFEEAYLRDGSLFEQVQALEEELIEDYVKGNLSRRERQRFERHYLDHDQPRRRARIEAARQLVRICSPETPSQGPPNNRIENRFFSLSSLLGSLTGRPLSPVLGVAAVILLLLGAGFLIRLLSSQKQSAPISKAIPTVEPRAVTPEPRSGGQTTGDGQQVTKPPGKIENPNRQLAQNRTGSQSSEDQIVFLALTHGARSLFNQNRAVISAGTSFVKLRVDLETQDGAPPNSYRAVVKTFEGDKEIWTQKGIKPHQRKSAQYVIISVPAGRFKAARAQDFMLTLNSLTADGKYYEDLYYFQVTAKRS